MSEYFQFTPNKVDDVDKVSVLSDKITTIEQKIDFLNYYIQLREQYIQQIHKLSQKLQHYNDLKTLQENTKNQEEDPPRTEYTFYT